MEFDSLIVQKVDTKYNNRLCLKIKHIINYVKQIDYTFIFQNN